MIGPWVLGLIVWKISVVMSMNRTEPSRVVLPMLTDGNSTSLGGTEPMSVVVFPAGAQSAGPDLEELWAIEPISESRPPIFSDDAVEL